MELASHTKAMVLQVQVEWTPRSGNKEADELAKGSTARFSPTLRVDVIPGDLVWQILPEAVRLGREAEEMFHDAKRNGAQLNRGRKQKRQRARERLSSQIPGDAFSRGTRKSLHTAIFRPLQSLPSLSSLLSASVHTHRNHPSLVFTVEYQWCFLGLLFCSGISGRICVGWSSRTSFLS